MKIEDRLRRELNDTAEHLALDKDTYEHVLDLGRRRRRSRQVGAAAGAAMIATVVVGVLAIRPPDTPGPIVATTTTTAPPGTTTTSAPTGNPIPATTGVLLATPNDGIVISGFDGSSGSLTSDTYYEGIAWVISDGAGGIIFQHEVTPLPWTQGAILQLPAVSAVRVFWYPRYRAATCGHSTPTRDSSSTGSIPVGRRRFGPSTPSTGAVHTVVPSTAFLVGAAAEDGVVVAALGGECPRLEVVNLHGSDPKAGLGVGRLPGWFHQRHRLQRGNVYTIEDGEGRNLVKRDFATGGTSIRRSERPGRLRPN